MRISIIFNTCSLDPLASSKQNLYRTKPYSHRANLLEETLNNLKGFDEIIVAGTFKEGDKWDYVPVQPRYRDRRDALYQREFGARYSTGDLLVFSHDDHAPSPDFARILKSRDQTEWDILVPERRHHLTDEVLNNGRDDNYMGGHLLVMKRWIWAEVSWIEVDTD
jgi:hypothetical protein